ncbi:hypothetical protein [Bacillus pseudomycoides]|uniref:hypothetical protein n=1 Tax=Bacillus pseudomycoides TaxID=64104 RepID=UPI000BF1A705|nr:hypothetical protein [Bacillus pseudomycoides]PEI40061.1 hypothetical protein CN641_25505 [Bacillus pseudomycoides]PGA64746.1 hypothetical protein COL87_28445 [Bacillus pseudomycoides]PHE16972.1 hypothetical protein COF59_10145 [Bacillus pseudomycoides]PHE94579.1 hypothetical protein COF78_13155 [Bacillus pseudomycoides]
MGILFSANPVTENRAYADVGTAGTILTTFGNIYDNFLAEPFANFLDEQSAKNQYQDTLENRAYKAPNFEKGVFGISVYDYYKSKDFSKKVKLAYPDGKVEFKTIKHGEQIKVKQVGTMVDLTPDEPDLFKHNIIYITQKNLNGDAGISLTNWKTFYLKSAPHKPNTPLGLTYITKHWGINALHATLNFDDYFNNLPYEKQVVATITSKPVSKEELFSLTDSDIDHMNYRMPDILTQHKEGEYSSLSTKISTRDGFIRSWEDGRLSKSDGNAPLGREDFTIIPIKKGSNKVLLKENLQYIPSVLGTTERYTISPDKVWTLHDTGLFGIFVLQNDKGQYLSIGDSSSKFTDQYDEASFLHVGLKEEEWFNWLNKWYPGK